VLLNPVTRLPRFRFTDLGNGFDARGINDRGEVVGNPAFLWQGGQLNFFPGGGSAYAINNAGRIVGTKSVGGIETAVFWDRQGNRAPLEKPDSTRPGCAYAVNLAGVAAGLANDKGLFYPCVWNPDGTMQFLGSEPGTAWGINSSNLVVGHTSDQF
jgi:uncharacterized membrane protein